jgi:hypothetical protein
MAEHPAVGIPVHALLWNNRDLTEQLRLEATRWFPELEPVLAVEDLSVGAWRRAVFRDGGGQGTVSSG